MQRSGHPVSRTNTQGRPARVPSPWMEKKISLTVSTALLRVGGGAAGRFPHPHAPEQPPLPAQPLANLVEEVARYDLGRRADARQAGVLVHVAVVEGGRDFAHDLLQVFEIDDHAEAVE